MRGDRHDDVRGDYGRARDEQLVEYPVPIRPPLNAGLGYIEDLVGSMTTLVYPNSWPGPGSWSEIEVEVVRVEIGVPFWTVTVTAPAWLVGTIGQRTLPALTIDR